MPTASLSIDIPTPQRAGNLVKTAEKVAARDGSPVIAPDHLMLVALHSIAPGSPSWTAVRRHRVDVERITFRMRRPEQQDMLAAEEFGRIACTSEALRVLARADLHAHASRSERVRPEHVLLAALDGADDPSMGSAHHLLERAGVDVRRFRRSLRRAARR